MNNGATRKLGIFADDLTNAADGALVGKLEPGFAVVMSYCSGQPFITRMETGVHGRQEPLLLSARTVTNLEEPSL